MQQVEQRFLLGLWAQGTRLTDTVPCGRDARQASGPQRREEAGDTRGVGGQAWRTFTGGGPGAWGLPVPTVLCGGPALHGTQDTRVHNTHMCTTHASALHLRIHHTRTTHVCTHGGHLRSSACAPGKSFVGLGCRRMGHSRPWRRTLGFGNDTGWSVKGPFPPRVLFLPGPLGAGDSPRSTGRSVAGPDLPFPPLR